MNYSGCVLARFIDRHGRRCYLIRIDGRRETALVFQP